MGSGTTLFQTPSLSLFFFFNIKHIYLMPTIGKVFLWVLWFSR